MNRPIHRRRRRELLREYFLNALTLAVIKEGGRERRIRRRSRRQSADPLAMSAAPIGVRPDGLIDGLS